MGEIKITWQAVVAFFLMLCILAIVGMAMKGNQAAITVLIAGGAVLLVVIGAGIAIVVNGQAARQEERRFQKNMVQDLQMMQQMQRLQNMQSQNLMRQVQQQQLPSGSGTALMFGDEVFAGLDEPVEAPSWNVRE